MKIIMYVCSDKKSKLLDPKYDAIMPITRINAQIKLIMLNDRDPENLFTIKENPILFFLSMYATSNNMDEVIKCIIVKCHTSVRICSIELKCNLREVINLKTFVAKFAHDALTSIAKKLVLTGCWIGCHRPEAPEELFKN